MVETKTSAIEIQLWKMIDDIKGKTQISVKDTEIYYEWLNKVVLKIEELRESRDRWANKYNELKKERFK